MNRSGKKGTQILPSISIALPPIRCSEATPLFSGSFSGRIAYAKEQGKEFVRLDNNTRLIQHYQDAGFHFPGMFDLKNTDGLPAHYHNVPACLFQIKVD